MVQQLFSGLEANTISVSLTGVSTRLLIDYMIIYCYKDSITLRIYDKKKYVT